jgi:ABC-2 type transport system ATP-binding protein
MEEAEAVADRVGIIDHGEILIVGTPKEIKEKTKSKNLEEAFLKLTGYNIREESADPTERMRRIHRR